MKASRRRLFAAASGLLQATHVGARDWAGALVLEEIRAALQSAPPRPPGRPLSASRANP